MVEIMDVMNSTPSVIATASSFQFWQTDVAFGIGVYGMLILLPLGVSSNILAFIVFGRLQPQSTTTLYLQALAIADLISLTWDTSISTAFPLIGIKLLSLSDWTCKLGIWLDMSSSVVASCALMLVAIDRLTLLYYGAFHQTYCTRRLAVVISIGLWVFTMTYCTPLIYFYELDAQNRCVLSAENQWKSEMGLAFVAFITYGPYFAVPAAFIIFTNVIIIRKMWLRKRNRRRMGKTDFYSDEVTKILIIDCLSFLILIGITAILWALCWKPASDDRQRAEYGLMFVLAQFISCCEESIDLFLYLACSKNFRRTFLEVVGVDNDEMSSYRFTSSEHRLGSFKSGQVSDNIYVQKFT